MGVYVSDGARAVLKAKSRKVQGPLYLIIALKSLFWGGGWSASPVDRARCVVLRLKSLPSNHES